MQYSRFCLAKRQPSSLEPRFDRICFSIDGRRGPVTEAQACINYLFALGTKSCLVKGAAIYFVVSGSTAVLGANLGPATASATW